MALSRHLWFEIKRNKELTLMACKIKYLWTHQMGLLKWNESYFIKHSITRQGMILSFESCWNWKERWFAFFQNVFWCLYIKEEEKNLFSVLEYLNYRIKFSIIRWLFYKSYLKNDTVLKYYRNNSIFKMATN